ncbi:MerR family transcriptional regulator [Jannaschia formosa]|uniref:MerR family transcriptional regulator n=1 Tax=Jannaschia formosa TaxID=2259592 RepID=UPI000E1C2525|nr:MerR family transcriptional regulator [Jannaschia formosa]TFL19653.1 MerR family transcriptional regulator [Jannaschia formosa]
MTRPPEKSGEAFRTIREVADWLGVPTHVLRFWESKFDQIAPVKGAGGRRYYRPEDMRLLGGIKVMLHDDGLTIRAVSQRIEESGVETIRDLSPALESGDPAPPQRMRRVIRKGDDTPPKPADEAKSRPEPPKDDPRADRMETALARPPAEAATAIAKDPATPPDETLPAQPDEPELPDGAPDPGEPLVEPPAPLPDDMPSGDPLPDLPPEEPGADPADPSDRIAPVPEPSSDPLPGDPADAPPSDASPPPPEAPAPADAATIDPLARARALARGAGALSVAERKRLRRIVRRYRALAEEIAEDLADEASN